MNFFFLINHCMGDWTIFTLLNPMQRRLLSKIKSYSYTTYTFDKPSRDRKLPSSASADSVYVEHEPKRANNKYLIYQHYI